MLKVRFMTVTRLTLAITFLGIQNTAEKDQIYIRAMEVIVLRILRNEEL